MSVSNTVSLSRPPATPWYKVSWVWLLIGLLSSSVLGSLTLVWIATSSFDGTVDDDYYKRGLQINRELARDEAAARYGLQALVRLDRDSNTLQIAVRSSEQYSVPTGLRVELLHHTRAGFDKAFVIEEHGNGMFRSPAPPLAAGVWTIRISADDWRLQGSSRLDGDEELRLQPVEY